MATTVHHREAPEVRRAQHDNARRIKGLTPAEPAAHPTEIAAETHGWRHVGGVLRGWRCWLDFVGYGWRRYGSVVHLHRYRHLPPGTVDLVLELSNTLRQRLHLGLARCVAGGIVARFGVWRTLANDLGRADTLGRREIADVDDSGRVDPRVNVRMSLLQSKRSGEH